jgi:cytochrome c biogenesis protein
MIVGTQLSVRRSVALVWRSLRSMRTALVLLLVIAAGAVVGSLFPQVPNSPERVGRYLDDHPFWGAFFFRAGFFDVFGSWWFVLITALLFVSLVACLIPRSRAALRTLRQRPVQARELDGFRHYVELSVASPPTEAARLAERLLRRARYRVAREGASVAGEKGALREAGSLIFHWAFLLLLVGVIVGKGTGFTGRAVLTEGESWVDALPNYAGEIRTGRYFSGRFTGVGIELLDFEATYRRSGLPKDFVSRVRLRDRGGRPTGTEEIRVNHPLSVQGIRIFQEGFGWSPVVTASFGGEQLWASPIEMQRDDAPLGIPAPAMPWRGSIKLTVPEPDVMITLELWPDARAFQAQVLTGEPVAMLVEFDPVIRYEVYEGRIIDPSRRSVSTEGLRRVGSGILRAASTQRVESTGKAQGLTLSFPELRQYTVLLVSRDVGIPVVLVAAILILAALLPALYVSRRKLWVRAEASPGGTIVKVGGFALQRRDAFEDEFVRMVRGIESEVAKVHAPSGEAVTR